MVFRRRSRRNQGIDEIAAVVDVDAVPPSLRGPLTDALEARRQFDVIVQQTPPGSLRDRLSGLAPQIDAGVLAVWHVVQRMMRLEALIATLDPDRARDQLKTARRDPAVDAEHLEALAHRFGYVQQLLNSHEEARRQLPVIEARMASAVAAAAVFTLTAPTLEIEHLRHQLDEVVIELDALAQAAAELR